MFTFIVEMLTWMTNWKSQKIRKKLGNKKIKKLKIQKKTKKNLIKIKKKFFNQKIFCFLLKRWHEFLIKKTEKWWKNY